MNVKSGQVWAGVIVCKDSAGALATPSVGPVGALYVNGTVNAASVTISGANPYKWSVTLPALTAGDLVSMYITATIASIATAGVVAEAGSDTKRTSELNDIAATAIVSSGAITTNGGAVSTVTTLTNAPANSAGVGTILADYARRTGDYSIAGDIPTANQNADALLDRASGVETSFTPRQALRLILAALAGKLSISGSTVTIRDVNDSKNRIVATTDADGQRTAVTKDVS